MNYNLRIKQNTGYTIIETMISVSLFLIIVITGLGSLLNANLLQQKSQSMSSIMDNLSFIMEDIGRNMRTGYSYHCFDSGSIPGTVSDTMSVPKSCTNGWGIAFEYAYGQYSNDGVSDAKDNDQWVYYIGPDLSLPGNPLALWKSTAGPYAAASFIKMTPDEVVLEPSPAVSGFAVLGAEGPTLPNTQQPLVNIRLVGKITIKGVVTPFSLQTSVSQRLIDV